jgi:putative ABC transport system permease protein
MLIGEILNVALGALRANKLRSFLTMLGIVIGVGAVIAMISIGNGAQRQIQERLAALGTTLLTISAGQQRGPGGFASETDRAPLTLDDAQALRDSGRYIVAVQPQMQRRLALQFGSMNANPEIVGTTSNYLSVRKAKLAKGRFFTDAEDNGKRRVAVVGPAVLEDLELDTPDAILNQYVRIRGIQFEVIGVLAPRGQGSMGGGNPDESVFVPIQTAKYRTHGQGTNLNNIYVLASSEQAVDAAMAEAQRVLRRLHKLRTGQGDNFRIQNQSQFLEAAADNQKTFTLLLAGIAGVSLIVGGIGIMNIMLVSVTERTREIGVRKALGATRSNILLQFLIEAVVLCLAGGMIGIVAGGGGAVAMARQMNTPTAISIESILLAFVFSAGVGVLFGVWPARRAAALDPIQALRYE